MHGNGVLRFWTALLFVGIVTIGCKQSTPTTPDQSSTGETKEYEIKGKVVAVGEGQTSVTLDHEDIEGLMKGMEMKFTVKDPRVISQIQAGDQVRGKLKVESGDYIITQLQKQ